MSDLNKNELPEDEAAVETEPEATTEADSVTEPEVATEAETPVSAKKKVWFLRLGPLRSVVLVVLIAILCASGYLLIDSYREYKVGDDLYKTLEQSYLIIPTTAAPALITPTPIPSAPVPSDDPVIIIDVPPEDPEDPEESSIPVKQVVQNYAPDIWPDVDWDGLNSVNSDTAAWLLCVGTNINYPVVYSHDNDEYLTRMFDGNYSKVGSIFVDARNSKGFTDRNTIIYGHNMRNHSMFWTLTQYKSQSFYNSHPTMRLITPEGKYELQLFAGIVANGSGEDVGTYWRTRFASDEDYTDWLLMLFENSTFKSYVDLTADDRVVMLSTCSYEFSNARYIVIGKLVPVS